MRYNEVWDAQAGTDAEAWRAVWAEAGDGIDHCMIQLADMPAVGDVLDLGAGVGRLAIPFAAAHPAVTVWAVDSSAAMLSHLAVRAAATGNVWAVLGNGAELPVKTALFGMAGAWSVLTFQHLPVAQQHAYLTQMAGRLAAGGRLVVQFVTGAEPGPLSHPVDPVDVLLWAMNADLSARVTTDGRFPTWRWLHATKL